MRKRLASLAQRLARPSKRRFLTLPRRKRLVYYLFFLPAFITGTALIVYPLGMAFNLSLQRYILGTSPKFIGVNNYVRMFQDKAFRHALSVSVIYTIGVTAAAYVIGLTTALLLHQKFRGRTLARLLVVLPWATPPVVAGLIWKVMLDSSFGVINYILIRLHLINRPLPWLMDPFWALVSVSVVTIWKGYPFLTLMLLAARQAIPEELYDAAKVDGAGAFSCFRYITWPGLRFISGIGIVLTATWVFRAFSFIFIMTGGGPARSTETLGIQVYQEAFRYLDFGYASAIGIFTLVVCILFTVVFLRATRKEFYS